MVENGVFRPGLELMTYLDGNLSSNGLDDPALGIEFYLPWWTGSDAPTAQNQFLCSASLKSALNHYRLELKAALFPFRVPHSILNLADELNKPAYTWHSSVNDMPKSPTPNKCTRCRLYRAVAVGVMDQLRDTYNMVHACQTANQSDKDLAIRRASGFNELFEAALKKESDLKAGSGLGGADGMESGPGSKGKGKETERPQFGPEVEELKKWMTELVMGGRGTASSKWTWGVDLTEDDLVGLIRGADRLDEPPHSGYDHDLPSGSLHSLITESLDPVNLEDPSDPDLRFDDLSGSITPLPELRPRYIPDYSAVLTLSGELVDAEPDPVIAAFSKRAIAKASEANKLLMQEEVDQPVSYLDYGSEFIPQTALIPRRPWLAPSLPIVLPPTHMAIRPTQGADPAFNDNIIMSDSDQSLILPNSDLSATSELNFPVSDEDDPMDVVRSDEQDVPMSPANADPGSDSNDIVFPESPVAMRRNLNVRAGGMAGIGRDPNTGHFTAASFSNFPDELLD
jgi:hypothetical protein